MNCLTLNSTCVVLFTATLLTTGCDRARPELPTASRSESAPRSTRASTPSLPAASRSGENDLLMHAALMDVSSASEPRGKRETAVHSPWEPALTILPAENRESYASLTRSATIQTSTQPVSTFSVDVDTGAYSNVRRFLQNGQLPPEDSVRVEELLNYFSYDYAEAAGPDQPFSVTTEVGQTPWNDKTRLLHIGLKGYVPPATQTTAANLVFLIDVSGSMAAPDKLGLLKSSISLLSHELTARDTVSIVVYAGSSGTVLEPTPGNQHRQIDQALARLAAGGSTNGAQGIELAYELASRQLRKDGINRVILATDGDFNVGISDVDSLLQLISRKRESGIALTTLGFGTGNYNDHLMEQLADAGNGSYAYIDTLGEARKVLVDEMQATLLTIASDVKIQVEFNPAVVSEYRLIGYSNRALANEDFTNDRVDAGEIGAGHTVTALYEIALHGEGGERYSPGRYEPAHGSTANSVQLDPHLREIAQISLRYKLPGASESLLSSLVVERSDPEQPAALSEDFLFSASVAAFGQLLQGDDRLSSFNFRDTHELAAGSLGVDRFGYRAEFLRLVDMAGSLHSFSRLEHEAYVAEEG